MTTWDDNPPDDCDAPESHPDGCACVRPREEPATWDRISLGGVVIGVPGDPPTLTDPAKIDAALPLAMPEGKRLVLTGHMRSIPVVYAVDRGGSAYRMPDAAHRDPVPVLSPAEVEPEHCPLCIEAEAQRLRLANVEPCPVHRSKERT
ncbi:hypothetical protein [Sorangium sp. So ce388]|uniref:hypothetical protein n=1 Tax=Sorangium sp. So ce388 TaxID=3133309 RepID=UPI003F5C9095